MSLTESRIARTVLTVKPGASEEMFDLANQLNRYLVDINKQLNRLTSGLYEKNDPTPYFIPKATVQGTVLFFNGTDWTILPPGTPGQKLQTNGAGANPTWV